jgi:hypothetical protein
MGRGRAAAPAGSASSRRSWTPAGAAARISSACRELAAIGRASVEIVRAGAIGPLDREILTGVSAVVVVGERMPRHDTDGAIAQLDAGTEVHRVGDCRHSRSALDAVYDGAVAGLRI